MSAREWPRSGAPAARWRFFGYALTAVVGILIGVVVAITQHNDEANVWGVFFGAQVIIAGGIIEIYLAVTSPLPLVEIVTEDRLKTRYEEMRKTDGARAIQAVWCSKYPNVRDYFNREKQDFQSKDNLSIQRIVNPSAIDPTDYQTITAMVDELGECDPARSRYRLREGDIGEIECFACEYVKDGSYRHKAMLVFLDTQTQTPKLGIYVDSERGGGMEFVAHSIRAWFRRLWDSLEGNEIFPKTG